MATRDYVGNSPRRRAGGRNIKKAAPRRFPVIPALLAGALVGICSAWLVWNLAFQLRRRGQLRLMPHIKRLRLRLRWARQA